MTVRELLTLPFELIGSLFDAIGAIFNAILDLDILILGFCIALFITIYLLFKGVIIIGEYRDKILVKIPNPFKIILSFLFNNLFLWIGVIILIIFLVIIFEMRIYPYIKYIQ